jgi:hypothetical protein
MAADDPRGTKVAAYNAAVTTWLEGGAFATWTAENAGITTFPIVVGSSGEETGYEMNKCSSKDWGDCELGASQTLASGMVNLNDEWSTELRTNTDSMIWSATVPGAHVIGRASGESSWTVRSPDETAPLASLEAYKCEYKRHINRCDSGPSTKKCYRNEHVSANRQWLNTINLVQNNGNELVLDPCPYTFESKSQGWVTVDNAANDDTAENEAKALCANSIPDEDIDITVVLRSARDPWVVAGQLTGCTYNFGMPAGNYVGVAVTFTVFGCIFSLPLVRFMLFVVFDSFGLARGSYSRRTTVDVEPGG